ncbi:MAG: PAS domain-containing protein [Bacteroidetes bacterium]|nr:PAS domain-containing protein [Bacteroidota bacterium]
MKQLPNILIVDDTKENLFVLEFIINKIEANLIQALSGQEALDKTKDIELALAIIDVRMPGMNGYEFAFKLNEERLNNKVPIIFLTASNYTEKDIFKGYETGAVDYIFKPFDYHILQSKIQVFIDLFIQKQTIIADAALLKETADELIRANMDIKKSELKFRTVADYTYDWEYWQGEDLQIIYMSHSCERITGFNADEFISDPSLLQKIIHPEDLDMYMRHLDQFISYENRKDITELEFRIKNKEGAIVNIQHICRAIFDENKKYIGRRVSNRDITERKQVEKYQEMGREVLKILNEPGSFKNSIQRVLSELKKDTGFDAIGIRLQDGEDYPYFSQEGFSQDFLSTENSLIERTKDGKPCRDKDGKIRLECTCGLVISGKIDPASPLFTKGGSFWINNSFTLLDLPLDLEPRYHPRNKCMHHGFASMALIPIRNTDRIVGLIHLNDRRKGCFNIEIVQLLEGIASHIGTAMMRKQVEEALLESEINLSEAQRIAQIGSWEWDIISNTLKWSKEMYHVFDISPDTFDGKPESLVKIIHPDDVEIFKNNININLLADVSDSIEYRVIHKDGSVHNIFSIGRIEFDKSGKPFRRIGTSQDITERKKAEDEKSKLEHIHQLMEHTEKAREKERVAISRDLHDDLGQSLTAMKIDLGMIKQNVSDIDVVIKINKLSNLVSDTIKTVQRLTSQLRPDIIDDLGLEAAIEWYTKEFAQRNSIEIFLDLESEIPISPEDSLVIFRIMQESLTNISRHSKATRVKIVLSKIGDNINFRASDNGIGISEDEIKSKKSFGLSGMKERAASLGGSFDIYPENGGGTVIKLFFPLK